MNPPDPQRQRPEGLRIAVGAVVSFQSRVIMGQPGCVATGVASVGSATIKLWAYPQPSPGFTVSISQSVTPSSYLELCKLPND